MGEKATASTKKSWAYELNTYTYTHNNKRVAARHGEKYPACPVQLTLESGDGRRVKSTQRHSKARKAEKSVTEGFTQKKKAL